MKKINDTDRLNFLLENEVEWLHGVERRRKYWMMILWCEDKCGIVKAETKSECIDEAIKDKLGILPAFMPPRR